MTTQPQQPEGAQQEAEPAFQRASAWGRLYEAANTVAVKAGHDGDISGKSHEITWLMKMLAEIDGGQYMPGLMPRPALNAPAAPAPELPPLPEPELTQGYGGSSEHYEEPMFSADQMHEYARAAQGQRVAALELSDEEILALWESSGGWAPMGRQEPTDRNYSGGLKHLRAFARALLARGQGQAAVTPLRWDADEVSALMIHAGYRRDPDSVMQGAWVLGIDDLQKILRAASVEQPSRVYLVWAGVKDGKDVYTRHDTRPPMLGVVEVLHSAPQKAPLPASVADMAVYDRIASGYTEPQRSICSSSAPLPADTAATALDRHAHPVRRLLVSVSSIDVERLIAECLPGGSSCDPQQVADSIRRYCDSWPAALPADTAKMVPCDEVTRIAADGTRTVRCGSRAMMDHVGRLAAAGQVTAGWQLVPVEPAQEMWGGLARDIVWFYQSHSAPHYGSKLHTFLTNLGREIPEWLAKEIPNVDHSPAKGTVAVCIYRAMLAAAPQAPVAGRVRKEANNAPTALAIELLVAAGHVSQGKADEAFTMACNLMEAERKAAAPRPQEQAEGGA